MKSRACSGSYCSLNSQTPSSHLTVALASVVAAQFKAHTAASSSSYRSRDDMPEKKKATCTITASSGHDPQA